MSVGLVLTFCHAVCSSFFSPVINFLVFHSSPNLSYCKMARPYLHCADAGAVLFSRLYNAQMILMTAMTGRPRTRGLISCIIVNQCVAYYFKIHGWKNGSC